MRSRVLLRIPRCHRPRDYRGRINPVWRMIIIRMIWKGCNMQTSVPGYRYQTRRLTEPNPNDYMQRSVIGIYNDAGEEVPLSEFIQAQRQQRQSGAPSRARNATPRPGGIRSRANNLTPSLVGGA